MTTENHAEIVSSQFSPRASSYLTSAVHAAGEDLEQMAHLVGDRPDAIALDMGCGGGHVAFRLAPKVKEVVAYDLSETMLSVVAEEAKRRGIKNLVTKQGSAERLSCPSKSFDVVASRYSAHHWSNVSAGLTQMHRGLKPGGLAVFMDVISPGAPLLDTWLQTMELLRDPSHVRDYSLVEWQNMLVSAGFVVCTATTFRLRMELSSWIERMQTPAAHVAAIRSLQQRAGTEVTEHFAIEADGSFTFDTMLISAQAGN